MHTPDFWTQSSEAMELTFEGNRLIAQEIARWAHERWHRLARLLPSMSGPEPRHLPPV